MYVVPSAGGSATRLRANDPPACAGVSSPGVGNSWARWSPVVPNCNKRRYYWLVFASSRLGQPFTDAVDAGGPVNFKMGPPTTPTSQLYLTAIVDDGSGTLTTYPAVYIWNQPTQTSVGRGRYAQSNYTPSWDNLDTP